MNKPSKREMVSQVSGQAKQAMKDFLTGKSLEDAVKGRISTELDNFMHRNIKKGLKLGKTVDEIIDFYLNDKMVMKFATTDGYTTDSFADYIRQVASEVSENISKVVEVEKTHKIGRNEPCPCGSGKKYKKCCGR